MIFVAVVGRWCCLGKYVMFSFVNKYVVDNIDIVVSLQRMEIADFTAQSVVFKYLRYEVFKIIIRKLWAKLWK